MMPPVSHVQHKTGKCASMRMGACCIDEDCSALCGPIKLFLSQNKSPPPGVQAIIQQPLDLVFPHKGLLAMRS